jgi:muramoyltetrapeptide carboxypeptidase
MPALSSENPVSGPRLLRPPRLRPGDQIGVISPAGPVDMEELRAGIGLLESSGFRVKVAPHVYDRFDYLAGRDEVRLEDLHAMFMAREIKAIFCARGGYGSPRLLDKIRYDLIGKKPKILVGYSDITALLVAIHKRTGLITFHGPMVRDLGTKDQGNWETLFELLSSGLPFQLRLERANCLIPGKATGSLLGGNLSLICHLLGTPYMPSLEGCILFLEEKGESLYRLDRMLTHLRLSGQLDRLSGLIGGQFENCGQISVIDELLMDVFSDLNIPIVTNLPIGHGEENVAVPIGLRAELDADLMVLSTPEACVS